MPDPRDTDPLWYDEDDSLWDPVDRVWVPRPSPLPVLFLGLIWGLVIGLLTGIFLASHVFAASGSAQTTQRVDLSALSSAGPTGAPRAWMAAEVLEAEATRAAPTPVGEVGAPSPAAVTIANTRPSATPRPKPPQVTGATVRGMATWYDDHRKSGLYAAVHSWRWGDTPYRVVVRAGDRTVVVTVSDYCLCTGGGDRVIDLSNEAFARLAPLSAGVVDVTVRGLR